MPSDFERTAHEINVRGSLAMIELLDREQAVRAQARERDARAGPVRDPHVQR